MQKFLFGILLLAVLHKAAPSALFNLPERNVDIDLGEVTNFTCPAGSVVAAASDCDKYYTCYENTPVHLMLCRLDFLFDLKYNGCNYPEQVDCGNRTRPTGTNPPPASTTVRTTPSPFTCPSDGFFPIYPNACSSSYYTCIDGVAYLQTCPGNGIFDPEKGICRPAESVPCSSITTTPGPTSGPFVCPSPDGIFPDPDDCSHYYTCTNGVPILSNCPPGLVFNPQAGVCDYPENVPGCQVKSKLLEFIKAKTSFHLGARN